MISLLLLAWKLRALRNVTRHSNSRNEDVIICECHPYWVINAMKKLLDEHKANQYRDLVGNAEFQAMCLRLIEAKPEDICKSSV